LKEELRTGHRKGTKDEASGMKNIMNALFNGKRDVFFKLWNRYVPVDI